MTTDYLKEAEDLFSYSQALRRDFHMHPELGFQEYRTAGIVAKELNKLNLEVTTGVAETGIVALLEGSKPGPTILVRFDMDALPIEEATGAAYASVNPGVMHACGHDAHTAVGLTVARLLHAHRSELSGTVKFVFQPAEEGLGGAARMVEEGVLENPRPDVSLALHIWNSLSFGLVGCPEGGAMAAADAFDITITGKGSHAAYPNLGNDPIIAASQIITALQTIVSRNAAPFESVVVSVTKIEGGTTNNIIPGHVHFGGTIRTYSAESRERAAQRLHEITEGIAASMNCQAEISFRVGTPLVYNEPEIARVVQDTVRSVFGTEALDDAFRLMGSEDMAFMMQDVPGCYFFVGSANEAKGLNAPHHNANFDIDEEVLPRAAGLMASAVARFLSTK